MLGFEHSSFSSIDRIAECFAFLVCTKWSNQSIHRYSHIPEPSSSSMVVRYLDWNRGLVVTADDEHQQSNRICGLQDIGGHVMKIPFITFQIILFMRLEVQLQRQIHYSETIPFSPDLS